jgi:hypothetical protein
MQPIEYLKRKQACQYHIGIKLNEANYTFDELVSNVYNAMVSEYPVTEAEVEQLVTESIGDFIEMYHWQDLNCTIRYEIPNDIGADLLVEEPDFSGLINDGSVNYFERRNVSFVYLNFIKPRHEKLLDEKGLIKELRDERFPFKIGIKDLPWHVDGTDFRVGIYNKNLLEFMKDVSYNQLLRKGERQNLRRDKTSLFYFTRSDLTSDELSLLNNSLKIETET